MQILGLLGMYFDAVVVKVEKYLLFLRLALAILCLTVVPLVLKGRPFFPSYLLVHNYTMSPFIFTKGAGKKRVVKPHPPFEFLDREKFGSLNMPSL